MGRSRRVTLAAGAALAAGGLAIAIARRRAGRRRARDRWVTVTVLRPPEELSGDARPQALAGLAEHYELRIAPALGGRGSELSVRPGDARARERLRAVKQVLETGEVLRVAGQPEGHRTPFGRVALPVAERLARKGV